MALYVSRFLVLGKQLYEWNEGKNTLSQNTIAIVGRNECKLYIWCRVLFLAWPSPGNALIKGLSRLRPEAQSRTSIQAKLAPTPV